INAITKKVYKELETFLIKNYEQWSGWFYIHNFFDTNELAQQAERGAPPIAYSQDSEFILNDFIHLIKHDEDNIFLVMKTKYEIMRIERFLFDVLTFFQKPRKYSVKEPLIIENEVVGYEFVEELIAMNYLKLAV